MPIQKQRITIIVLTVAVLLIVPLIAMQFTNEVNWTVFDFLVAGGLLLCTGFMCEFVVRKIKKTEYRITICVALLLLCFLAWIELAVGIFGTPFAGK